MNETYVTGETLVGEVVSRYPEAIEILLSIGMPVHRHALPGLPRLPERVAGGCLRGSRFRSGRSNQSDQ